MNRLKEEQREEKRRLLGLPIYSASEEILSAVSHGIGVLLSIAALVLLLVSAPGDPIVIVSLSIYSATLILLYLVSTLYHALGVNKGKRVFRILDHCSIFLLIAGTYTPLSLVIIGGTVGWVLFGVIWAAAVVGIVFNAVNLKRFQRLSMVCYICMGWAVIFAAKPLAGSMPFWEMILLLAGGVFYTVGAALYGIGKKRKYVHSLWHLFVLAGSIFHFFCIYGCLSSKSIIRFFILVSSRRLARLSNAAQIIIGRHAAANGERAMPRSCFYSVLVLLENAIRPRCPKDVSDMRRRTLRPAAAEESKTVVCSARS